MSILNNTNRHEKNDLATFWAILETIGQLFIPSSGHTDFVHLFLCFEGLGRLETLSVAAINYCSYFRTQKASFFFD